MKRPTPEELKARAKRLADKYTGEAPPPGEPPAHWPSLNVEDPVSKARRYANAQCRRRKAELARGKVSTLSQGVKA